MFEYEIKSEIQLIAGGVAVSIEKVRLVGRPQLTHSGSNSTRSLDLKYIGSHITLVVNKLIWSDRPARPLHFLV